MRFHRRQFLKTAGTVATVALSGGAAATRGVSLVIDPSDPIAGAAPAQWAAKELEDALKARGVEVRRVSQLAQAGADSLRIVAAGANTAVARDLLKSAGLTVAAAPEALAVASTKNALLATGHDSRGLVYALLDLTDRVRLASDALVALTSTKSVAERPYNVVRSNTRLFTSDVEDKPWYNDREMWPQYLTMLATNRYNRFNLAFGIGYDFLREVTDAYFVFSYPFLLNVPGYNVRVPQLPDSERDHNLEMLRYISEQTVARGMQFQLGLWMHGYEWINSPKPNYTIAGLTKDTHGPYCRDAVRMLLKEVPLISGVTFRIHGESGVEEGSYEFWKTVFSGVATCGRTVEIDMHSKGMDQGMMDLAVNAGPPIKISTKYWAEFMGMPYHQADIRELERPVPGKVVTGLMNLSTGSRAFTRYGYGDLMREDRKFGVLHRIWPGTQRLLIWGDPLTAAAHSRAFTFCGSDGVEIQEPLSFKGRRGSGIAGDRCAYADKSLKPRWDWEKYVYSHRVWGRMLYNPNADPESWRRLMTAQFAAAAPALEAALGNASRILPIVTTGYAASAGNNTYWPEVYLNQSMIDGDHPGPYRDSPAPRVFGNVSPLDPQLFSRINDHADDLLKGERSAKYSPIEVAQWLEDYANAASKHLAQAESVATGKDRPEYRRLAIDIAIQAGLGRFYGAKFRSGVLYRIFEVTGDRTALEESLKAYRAARAEFAALAETGKVYMSDITVGENPQLRGHWRDRLPAMDADIALVAKKLDQAKSGEAEARVVSAIKQALGRPVRTSMAAHHAPATKFRAGQALPVELTMDKPAASVKLYYRHVDQAERYETATMDQHGNRYRSTIPATYTDSQFPIEYYFELRQSPDVATLYPGLGVELTTQPYFVVRRG